MKLGPAQGKSRGKKKRGRRDYLSSIIFGRKVACFPPVRWRGEEDKGRGKGKRKKKKSHLFARHPLRKEGDVTELSFFTLEKRRSEKEERGEGGGEVLFFFLVR